MFTQLVQQRSIGAYALISSTSHTGSGQGQTRLTPLRAPKQLPSCTLLRKQLQQEGAEVKALLRCGYVRI